ncbi:hypothetical protein LTR10_020692 [Elasticomyces elasticus]|uniref:Polysaccharide pyruvyl transferase domain-containing protein n=1 Tax=Exophiala sideris TaxID=1016849 RepID=A0ABR0JHK5_9EURO|nr:hypothetical protein LTR10_020692 [Elasticomyces elasticus]KAK5033561.1 hypothetical protein LTS07_003866 [Exophiala sideris]KAK5041944.1 hypothetical protein LTR13_001749 [Exophiala sideris]KAK5064105.1 hypothetical protein LTR69_003874 [Exophiala sideris]KAK5185212.1 hypothetical protein LTR44_002200 [Eurotiomycetes sp. CCFEE 6388]
MLALASSRFGRGMLAVVALLITFKLLLVFGGSDFGSSLTTADSLSMPWGPPFFNSISNRNISFDLSTPPTHGCEGLVNDLQQRLIHHYSKALKGIRYANIWGYLETENKGDAAIWAAQQILLSMLGIETMEACRFLNKCDLDKFTGKLEEHRPHSAIIMAGGGNFNDFYWEDQPSRMKMIETFTNVSVRAFPQSIYMTKQKRIQATKEAFGKHHDLQLVARDAPSHEWLVSAFGNTKGIETDLVPDIAFMWGNRSDFRTNTKKTHDILILAREDWEVSAGKSKEIAWGEGSLDLGGHIGNVTYQKVDWKVTQTPDIDGKAGDQDSTPEDGKNQRAWAKAIAGFELLGSAKFVITDRLHGHILATLIGVPHILMDSKLGKNLNFHNTWTRDCECTRIAPDINTAFDLARMFFEQNGNI